VRTLKFIVDRQIVKKDPTCDFSGLIKGTKGYLKAQFIFSSAWNGCAKVAGFSSNTGEEYKPQPLDENGCCLIPEDALKRQSFNIQVFGKREGYFILTNKINIVQDGGTR
jgi:hypothetical protein